MIEGWRSCKFGKRVLRVVDNSGMFGGEKKLKLKLFWINWRLIIEIIGR